MSVELNDITSGYSTGLINDNFQLVEDELNNNVLRRNGLSSGEANQMEVGLDMNSNFVYNLPEPVLEHQAARLQDVQNALSGGSANLITFTPYGNISSGNVQGAIQELVEGTGQAIVSFTGTQSATEALDDRAILSTLPINLKGPEIEAAADGVTDDTTKLQSALNLAASSGRPIYIPSSDYLISSQLTYSGPALTVLGDGLQKSRLVWDSASATAGLSIQTDNDSGHVCLSGFSVLTEKAGLDNAISVDMSNQQNVGGTVQRREQPRLLVSNVLASGIVGRGTDGWNNGLVLTDILHATVNGFHCIGHTSGTSFPTDISSDNAIWIKGTGSPVEILIQNSWAFWVSRAIRVGGNTEGVFLTNNNFVAVEYGCEWATDDARPQLTAIGNHVNCYRNGFRVENCNQPRIANNLIYRRGESTVSGFGVTLINCTQPTVIENDIYKIGGGSSPNWTGVNVGSGCVDAKVSENFGAALSTGIAVLSGATDSILNKNRFSSTTTEVSNSGTNTIVLGYEEYQSGLNGYYRSPIGHLEQWGSSVVTTNASGEATIDLHTAYSSTGYVAIPVDGDSGATARILAVEPSSKTSSAFTVVVQDAADAPIASATLRVDWHTKG